MTVSVPIKDGCSLVLTFTHLSWWVTILCTLQAVATCYHSQTFIPQTDVQQEALPQSVNLCVFLEEKVSDLW